MSDSKGAAIDDLLKYFWPTLFPQGKPPIEVTFNNGELVFQVSYHTFKQAILAILAQEVKQGRIDENQGHLRIVEKTFGKDDPFRLPFLERIKDLERLG